MRKKVFARQKDIARERITELFKQAESSPGRAKRYIALARRISTRCKVRIPPVLRRRMCKNCNAFLIPGKNCTIRSRPSRMVYHCLDCGNVMRYPYLKERKKK